MPKRRTREAAPDQGYWMHRTSTAERHLHEAQRRLAQVQEERAALWVARLPPEARTLPPALQGLAAHLPPHGAPFPLTQQRAWLDAMRGALDLVYGEPSPRRTRSERPPAYHAPTVAPVSQETQG